MAWPLGNEFGRTLFSPKLASQDVLAGSSDTVPPPDATPGFVRLTAGAVAAYARAIAASINSATAHAEAIANRVGRGTARPLRLGWDCIVRQRPVRISRAEQPAVRVFASPIAS